MPAPAGLIAVACTTSTAYNIAVCGQWCASWQATPTDVQHLNLSLSITISPAGPAAAAAARRPPQRCWRAVPPQPRLGPSPDKPSCPAARPGDASATSRSQLVQVGLHRLQHCLIVFAYTGSGVHKDCWLSRLCCAAGRQTATPACTPGVSSPHCIDLCRIAML